MTAEKKPQITEEHKKFGERVVALSYDMSVRAIQRIKDMFGEPPTQYARDALDFAAYSSSLFLHDGLHRSSRPRTAEIAASNFIVFHEVTVPDEVHNRPHPEPKDHHLNIGAFPARILDLSLVYGEPDVEAAHLWTARMFSGKGTPPAFVNRDALREALDATDGGGIKLSRLSTLQDKLPKSAFHYPSEEEVKAILEGLAAAEQDIDLYALLKASMEHCLGNYMDMEGEWFHENAATIRPAWEIKQEREGY